jgi:anti-sigma factor (TIGR02949 family)
MTTKEMDCEQALARLFEFLDHELQPEESDAVQHHLSTCRTCFSRANFESRLKGKLQELPRDEPVEQARDRVKRLLESF